MCSPAPTFCLKHYKFNQENLTCNSQNHLFKNERETYRSSLKPVGENRGRPPKIECSAIWLFDQPSNNDEMSRIFE